MKVFTKGKIWTALGSLMDRASSNKQASTVVVPDRALLADIEAAIARCTDSGGDAGSGSDDRHVHEILFLVSNAPGAITFLSRRISARLEAARTPAAALRSLLLIHRLLRAGDRYFEQDFRGLWASRDLRIDTPRCSCSCSSSSSLDSSTSVVNFITAPKGSPVAIATGACSFLHGYTAYLEERMQWVINQAGNLEPTRPPAQDQHPDSSSSYDDAAAEALLFKLAMCQRLLDVAVQLLPDNNTSSASAAARSAFGIVLRESFKVYDAFKEGLDVMLLRSRSSSSVGLSKSLRVSGHEVLRKACAQTPELKEFYHKCKKSNASKVTEYPVVRVVTPAMELMPPVSEEDKPGCGEAAAEESEGDAPFESKLETTISAVWVEFDGDDDRLAGCEATGGDGCHRTLHAQQPS
ncbi:putative clathrin assembly protein At1g33340 [Brachypodium distachyon]|uniref:ENTH domain-containing protein n=1 Tax=Brachypodium distachyon TaxID=15368 RepID=I1IM82_BRADI|nr:putative clathrin assembly protein At1g33340 [Brachypodium distachyon]KQJ88769.1 hypothetical protein BRADI_4g21050v3 [Brachypodium distachyon]|eukprot:XP_003576110.1 putative clathrin assembly protein At1g33340 [Brachypodium distachyon]